MYHTEQYRDSDEIEDSNGVATGKPSDEWSQFTGLAPALFPFSFGLGVWFDALRAFIPMERHRNAASHGPITPYSASPLPSARPFRNVSPWNLFPFFFFLISSVGTRFFNAV